MDNLSLIKRNIQNAIDIKLLLLKDIQSMETIHNLANLIVDCFKNEGKLLLCGNGGSAADAQHLAAEFSGRFYYDRPPLFSEALHVNSSYLTAVANDYSFDEIYARMIKGMGKKGDILIGLSTSGNSNNVINAIKQANKLGVKTIGFTGKNSGKMEKICDFLIAVPSEDTPRIQESHMLIGHIICEIVEKTLFPKKT